MKPFRRGAMPKGKLNNAKSVETGMLLERIEKVKEVQNLLLDRLDICNGFERLEPISLKEPSPCDNCSRLDHIKLDCPIMAVQGKGMYRQDAMGGPSQYGRPNYLGS